MGLMPDVAYDSSYRRSDPRSRSLPRRWEEHVEHSAVNHIDPEMHARAFLLLLPVLPAVWQARDGVIHSYLRYYYYF